MRICSLAVDPFTSSSYFEFLPPPRQIPTVCDKNPDPDSDVVSTYDSRKVSENFSLLRTCRFIYSLIRSLPLQLYPLRLDCSVLGTNTLADQIAPKIVQSWQWASLRRLEIKLLHARDLASFLQLGRKEIYGDASTRDLKSRPEAGVESSIPLWNLDSLVIETRDIVKLSRDESDWISSLPSWYMESDDAGDDNGNGDDSFQGTHMQREFAQIPRRRLKPYWLLCLIYNSYMRFKHLEIVSSEEELNPEYWTHVYFIGRLLEQFQKSERKTREAVRLGRPSEDCRATALRRFGLKATCLGSNDHSHDGTNSTSNNDNSDSNNDDPDVPEWTIYHSVPLLRYPPQPPAIGPEGLTSVDDFDRSSRIHLFHTPTIHLHKSPEWPVSALPVLKSGASCVQPPFEESDPDFIRTRYGAPWRGLYYESGEPIGMEDSLGQMSLRLAGYAMPFPLVHHGVAYHAQVTYPARSQETQHNVCRACRVRSAASDASEVSTSTDSDGNGKEPTPWLSPSPSSPLSDS